MLTEATAVCNNNERTDEKHEKLFGILIISLKKFGENIFGRTKQKREILTKIMLIKNYQYKLLRIASSVRMRNDFFLPQCSRKKMKKSFETSFTKQTQFGC